MFDVGKKVDVALMAWEQIQAIARSCDESAAKVRAFGLAIWSGLLAYGYTKSDGFVYLVALITIFLSCIGEVGIRQIQYSFIQRSFEIEKSLDAFMVNDHDRFIAINISTHISTPTFKRFLGMFSKHRWLIWGPYGVAALFTCLAYLIARFGK